MNGDDGVRLRKAREAMGWQLDELADIAGIPTARVAAMEEGREPVGWEVTDVLDLNADPETAWAVSVVLIVDAIQFWFAGTPDGGLRALRVNVPTRSPGHGIQEQVATATGQRVRRLTSLGPWPQTEHDGKAVFFYLARVESLDSVASGVAMTFSLFEAGADDLHATDLLTQTALLRYSTAMTAMPSGVATVSELQAERGGEWVWSGRFRAAWQSGPLAVSHARSELSLDEALAWARGLATRVIVTVGNEQFSAGAQPIADAPAWDDRTVQPRPTN